MASLTSLICQPDIFYLEADPGLGAQLFTSVGGLQARSPLLAEPQDALLWNGIMVGGRERVNVKYSAQLTRAQSQ